MIQHSINILEFTARGRGGTRKHVIYVKPSHWTGFNIVGSHWLEDQEQRALSRH